MQYTGRASYGMLSPLDLVNYIPFCLLEYPNQSVS